MAETSDAEDQIFGVDLGRMAGCSVAAIFFVGGLILLILPLVLFHTI